MASPAHKLSDEDFAATLSKGAGVPVEDKEVDDLLSQFEEENLLILKVNGHRSGQRWENAIVNQNPDASDDSGIGSSLAARLASLKGCNQAASSSAKETGRPVASESALAAPPSPDVDVLGAELATRMQALKGPSRKLAVPLPSLLGKSTTQGGFILPSGRPLTLNNADLSVPPVAHLPQAGIVGKGATETGAVGHLGQQSTSRSFWGKGRRTSGRKQDANGSNYPPALAEDGPRVDVDDSEVNSLLASIVDDITMKKQLSISHSFASSGGYMEDRSGSEDDLDEDRVEREADEVVHWAKDSIALESSCEAKTPESGGLDVLGSMRQAKEGHLEGEEEEMDHGYWQDDEGGRSEEETSGSGSFGRGSGGGRGLKRKS